MRAIHIPCFLGLVFAANASAVSTPLTYQGSLEDAGVPANGSYDFAFQLKSSGGTPIGAALLVNDVVVVGGVFTVQLDFGGVAFDGSDRRLGISVRPGASVGLYTPLAPDAALNAAPYAQFANISASANDVLNGSIDEVDIATSAVSARTIATGAVGSAELAGDSVGVVNLIGAAYVSPNNLNTTLGANSCGTFDVGVAGGFEPGDWVILNLTTAIPANVLVTPLEVVSTNVVRIRFCNNGASSTSIVNAGIRMISLR